MAQTQVADAAGTAPPGKGRAATVAAYGVACAAHLIVAGLVIGGLTLVVFGWATIVQPVIGVVLLGVAAQLRPRLGTLASDWPTLRRGQAPALFTLLDAVADELGERRVDAVRITSDFAVRASAYGVRRHRVLDIGLPLWVTSRPEQRVAALAQELAYCGGDVRRGTLVATALTSLNGAMELAAARAEAPAGIWTAAPGAHHADEMSEATRDFKKRGRIVNYVLWIPQLVMKGLTRALLRLTVPAARYAEFRADAEAARIASTPAVVALLRDRRSADSVCTETHRLAVATRTFGRGEAVRNAERDFWTKVADHAATLPDRAPDFPDDTDAEDPRVARLSQETGRPATVTLGAAEAAAVESELEEARRLVARKIIQECVLG
ncbi:M48 family metallopeptidase [Streptomyces ossamyceticus]|uniref:M48 family metallopeptidase n=1 Tax=Streptomyces ossamyceticus TaxID=249581 RepID=A0ABV2V8Q8_9ACTN